ncbi:MAG: DEAD/DEAH box helicase [Gammaproteobacteria bacterium]
MICDTNYILDPNDRACPKLGELEKILEECRDNAGVKVLVFSEWERMLELVRDLCRKRGLGCAWHTGSVPQLRRRAEINLFKNDPDCRVFLSTDSGSTGLNLQNASVVINCDLPWNPARLEQRIARAWRKFQSRPVTVINLVSQDTIEERMLGTLANKQALAEGVLERKGDLAAIPFGGGKQAFLDRLNQLIQPAPPASLAAPQPLFPADRARAFAERARERLNGALIRCEEQYPLEGSHSVLLVVVDRDPPNGASSSTACTGSSLATAIRCRRFTSRWWIATPRMPSSVWQKPGSFSARCAAAGPCWRMEQQKPKGCCPMRKERGPLCIVLTPCGV